MKWINSLKFLSLLLFASCLMSPGGDSDPDCGTSEVFDRVSRSCIAAGMSPQPSLRSISIPEDTETVVGLSYTDSNNGQANDCRVSNVLDFNLDIYSPLESESGTRAQHTTNAALDAYNYVYPQLSPADKTTMDNYRSGLLSANSNAQIAVEHFDRVATLDGVIQKTRDIANLALTSSDVTAQKFAKVAALKADELSEARHFIENRCYCTGGVCETVLNPAYEFNGVSGFSYTLTDAQDGTSDPLEVRVTVVPVNDAPIAYNFSLDNAQTPVSSFFSESSTSTPTSYAFTIPAAEELDSDDALFVNIFKYELIDSPTQGVVSDCMGLNGSLENDRDCIYTPLNGDTNGVGAQAVASFQGIAFYAAGNGAWGNDVTIKFEDQLNIGHDPVIHIDGHDITIFIEQGVTVTDDVFLALVNDPFIPTLLRITQPAHTLLFSTSIGLGQNGVLVNETVRTSLTGGINGHDSFTYRVYDNQAYSQKATVEVSLVPQDDPPVINTDQMLPIVINEDEEIEITIDWSDAENDIVTSCGISPRANPTFRIIQPCTCNALLTPSECKFKIVPIDNYNNTINDLEIWVQTSLGVLSDKVELPITVTPVNDPAFPSFFNIEVAESETSQPLSYSFSIPEALDVDIPQANLTYSIVEEPLNGVLSDCLGKDGSDLNDLDCIYTPAHGNLTGQGTPASRVIQDLRVQAIFDGIMGETIFVEYKNDPLMEDGDIRITNDGLSITIYFDADSNTITAAALAAAINSSSFNIFVPMFVEAYVVGDPANPQKSNSKVNLVGATNGMDHFKYTVSDGNTAQEDLILGSVTINVLPANDKPVMCSYTKFKDAHECGLLGCIGDQSPVDRITPSASGIVFYHVTEAVCYQSTGTTAADWSPVDNYIPDVAINEKDKIVIDKIKVDEGGGDPTEDEQTILIYNVTSSDSILIPLDNIRFFFNNVDVNNLFTDLYPISFGDLVESEDSRDFRIEITPVGGLSGESTITITFQDAVSGMVAKTETVSFKVTVNSVSASHQGWKDIKAVGPKVNKHGQVLDHEKVCTFSRTKCEILGISGKECLGAGDPNTLNINADESGAIYYDSNNKNCYIANGTGDSTNWNMYNSYCSATPREFAQECTDLGAACAGESTPTIVPSAKNLYYFDYNAKTCYRSVDTSSSDDWKQYDGPGEVTLRWEDFLISGIGSITGFNVYRRLAGEKFDYDWPINKEVISVSLDKYVDNEVNSWYPPMPSTVYFYEVRPIINGIPTETNEVYKTVRVTVPPSNMSLVHRWMANKTMCDKLHATDIDPTNNYRCKYIGPGDRNGFYDLGEDLIVDRFEAACNFSPSPMCDTAEGSCTGNFDPHTNVVADQDAIFYNRENGKCYINTDGGFSWTEVDETVAAVMEKSNTPENPPLVYFDQLQAARFCAMSSNLDPIMGVTQPLTKNLPTRRQQVVYSQWDEIELSDTTINNTEAGLSMNSSSKCNTASASGLSQFYSDSQIPDSNTYYSLPGSETSGIRSIMTGSKGSAYGTYGSGDCESKFKVQDAVGNVSEWTMERLTCSTPASCNGVIVGDPNAINPDPAISMNGTNNDLRPTAATYSGNYSYFGLGNIPGLSYFFGPCSDTNADDVCDAPLYSWKFEEERFGSSRFIVPMGLPAHEQFPIDNDSDPINDYLFEIGPSSGITSIALHDDGMVLNSADIFADENNCGAMATGGSYLNGSDAGSYFFEMIPCSDDTGTFVKAHLTLGDVTFRSISNNGENIFVNFIDPSAANQVTTASISGTSGVDVILGTDANGDINATAQDIATAVNGNGSLALFVEAIVSGDATNIQNTTTDPVFLQAAQSKTKRVDIGFRCVTPVNNYDE